MLVSLYARFDEIAGVTKHPSFDWSVEKVRGQQRLCGVHSGPIRVLPTQQSQLVFHAGTLVMLIYMGSNWE